MNYSFENRQLLSFVSVGALSAILTLFSATVLKDFFINHTLLAIILVLLLSPFLIFPFRLYKPQLKELMQKYLVVIMPSIVVTLLVLSLVSFLVLGVLLLVHLFMCMFLGAFKRNHIGIEIIMLITVLSGVAYGPRVGAVIGALSMLIDYIFSGRLSMFSIITIPTYALVGVLAAAFASTSIFTLGIALTLFYNFFSWIFILGFMGGDLEKCLRFGLTNLGFNVLLFSSFAPSLLQLMR